MLWGRRSESRTLDRLLADVRAGNSRALVIHGEEGVGKTALLDHIAERASGFRVARAAGVHAEMELAFAALHQLCAPMVGRLDRLPPPQRDALRVAFGLSDGPAPSRFVVGLAVLSLLADVARERPLLCLVDDAQCLDRASAQTLAFVGRRLSAESVALIFAVREPGGQLTGIPDMRLEGLADADARALLASAIRGPLDDRVREQIIAETRGNPLALLELPRGFTPAELAGGFGLSDAHALPGRIEASFQRRMRELPEPARQLLLIAAADPSGDPELVRRAATRLGLGPEAVEPAAADGLLEMGDRLRFRHPLVRSAVYRAASPEERWSAHRALAAATDPAVDPDRRAWHRAHATPGADEEVAAELEQSAGRAQARGGLAAAAAFLERAAELTPAPAPRARRALYAAQAEYRAGAPDAALRLLAAAEAGPLDPVQRATVELLRAKVAVASGPSTDAPRMLLDAARQLEPLDVELARETYLDAIHAAIVVGRLAGGEGLREVAEAVRRARLPPARRPRDLLLESWALRITEGYAAAAEAMKRALTAFRTGSVSREEEIRWLGLAIHTAFGLWDDEAWHDLSRRWVTLARDSGALIELAGALHSLAGVRLFEGDRAAAAELLDEANSVVESTGSHIADYAGVWLAACGGHDPAASELIASATQEARLRGEGLALTVVQSASAMLHNGLGRYEAALAAAEQASAYPHDYPGALSELVEAAVRIGSTGRAADALHRLSDAAHASGTDWALGVEACSRALVSRHDAADALYREAIDRLRRTRMRFPLARAHLVYGEWLRRERRRVDARGNLRTAHALFTAMGSDGFAERAARELSATGATARKRSVETRGELTAQEAQIARLARDGLSNAQIASQLFISPRTVEYHLHKVFTKLDITSRGQLEEALSREAGYLLSRG
jgi:DNA-binding CsgD family transcriptional regulator